jgi:hypothetical protein
MTNRYRILRDSKKRVDAVDAVEIAGILESVEYFESSAR